MISAICYQTSLFDLETDGYPLAVNCFTKEEIRTAKPSKLMERLFPGCEYSLSIGNHQMALKQIKATKAPDGLEFCHFIINGLLYYGVFIGGETI